MKVLIIGGGGRCHAIAEAMSRSPKVTKIYCAPGNVGIAQMAELVNIRESDVQALAEFAKREQINLTIVGPEAALDAGIVDMFRSAGLPIFGPTKAATRIESSKEYAKELMIRHNVPTAQYRVFEEYQGAAEYLHKVGAPIVLKYDGLAAGKGVVVAMTQQQADEALKEMLMERRFGEGSVIVEEYLEGEEFSAMFLVSEGGEIYPMAIAQDHKRAYEGDEGPNTGGMGAYSPVPFVTVEDQEFVMQRVVRPVVEAMREQGSPFSGVLYAGLIKTSNGIKVIEFNARFGDPETEVVLPRMKSDLYEVLSEITKGQRVEIEWYDFATVGIVLASKGYPEEYQKGAKIDGVEGVKTAIYHMGTAEQAGQLVTNGGRVMIVVGRGSTLQEAQAEALAGAKEIECDSLFYRKDIASKALV